MKRRYMRNWLAIYWRWCGSVECADVSFTYRCFILLLTAGTVALFCTIYLIMPAVGFVHFLQGKPGSGAGALGGVYLFFILGEIVYFFHRRRNRKSKVFRAALARVEGEK